MRIVGVIDLLGGRAVHARGGCRHGYRPVEAAADTRIDGDAAVLARVYTEQLGVAAVYVADLDAIAGGAGQDLPMGSPALAGAPLWLDAGVFTVAQAERALDRGASRVVVGLETLTSFAVLEQITKTITPDRVVFSLDLREGRPLAGVDGIRELSRSIIAAKAADAGARSIIVLDLARVGSGRGLDLPALEEIRRAVPDVELMAGGGVRGSDDLRALAAVGCEGALVATALHLPGGADLVRFAALQPVVTRTSRDTSHSARSSPRPPSRLRSPGSHPGDPSLS